MIALWLGLAVAGAWLTIACYQALLCPPVIGDLEEPQVFIVLLLGMVAGLLMILAGAVGAVHVMGGAA